MNEKQYLEVLEKQLQKINKKERADIRRDFEEYFENGRQEGKSTEEIIEALGSPEQLAEELLQAYSEDDFVEAISVPTKQMSIAYQNINVMVDNANFTICPTHHEEAYLEVKDKDNRTETSLEIVNDTLVVKIKRRETIKRFLFITIIGDIGRSDVTLYVPEKLYRHIKVHNDNGYIIANNIHAQQHTFESDNGRIVCEQFKSDNLFAETSNGRIVFTQMDAGKVEAETDNGRIIVENSKAEQWQLKTDNGRIELKEVTGQMKARTSNGRIEAHVTKFIGETKMQTSNGSVSIFTPQPLNNVAVQGETDWGLCTMYGQQTKSYSNGTPEANVFLKTSNGKIVVALEEVK